ncbi:hypothetical protein, partial [Pseudomonas sp. BMS12]|uniref:hypothetical protein n=1 Tax=Pseudomonas sp. BMS12 TaxID=1796033 RepID=UPI003FA7D89E
MTQAQNLQVGDLQVAGGRWSQSGFDLNADNYSFVGNTFQLSGAFNQVADELIVDGYTAELAKSYSWSKVRVINGGVITTPVESSSFTQGITITADEVEVDASSKIDVSGKGKQSSAGLGAYGGGSYGGTGGTPSNTPYGDFNEPQDFGSGGGNGGSSYTRGGGAIALQVSELKLEGQLLANGLTQYAFGSGSGGSLLLRADTLILGEQAKIEAKGGGIGSPCCYASGGGGGRIAVHYRDLQKATGAVVMASGGPTSGWPNNNVQHGAAGTIYWNDLDGQQELVIDNSGIDKARAATTVLNLGADGELAAKLTVINANVELIGAKLGEMSLKDSTAKVQVGEI